MSETLEAIYENGVFRPLQPLAIHERQRVTLIVRESESAEDLLDSEYLKSCRGQEKEEISLARVRQALAKIPGSLVDDFRAEREDR